MEPGAIIGIVVTALVIGAIYLSAHLWHRARRRRLHEEIAQEQRNIRDRQALDEAVAAQDRLREEMEEDDRKWEEELRQDLLRRQRERQRLMPRVAHDNRQRMPHSRRPWPQVAGTRARNAELDRSYKERANRRPSMERKVIATVGPFRLSKFSRVR